MIARVWFIIPPEDPSHIMIEVTDGSFQQPSGRRIDYFGVEGEDRIELCKQILPGIAHAEQEAKDNRLNCIERCDPDEYTTGEGNIVLPITGDQLVSLRFIATTPDAVAMVTASDSGLQGEALVRHWDEVGLGDGGFYDSIRRDGCSSCGSHTPGNCDGCA